MQHTFYAFYLYTIKLLQKTVTASQLYLRCELTSDQAQSAQRLQRG